MYYEKARKEEQLKQRIESDEEKINTLIDNQNKLTRAVALLMESDRNQLKSLITQKHHYYCYTVEAIDTYTLDTIERLFNMYVAEGGNSFVEDLMEEIRALPRKSACDCEEKK